VTVKEAEERARDVASATGSVLAEVPGEFSAEFEADVAAYVCGDIGAHELAERAVGGFRRPPGAEDR
jgi:hypothetical protein